MSLVLGHRIDVGGLRRDLMHLLCIHLAKRPLLEKEFGGASHHKLFDDFAESEITRLLLHAAALLRIIGDQVPEGSAMRKSFDERKDTSLGSLRRVGSSRADGLTLRSACNKLIHTREVTLTPRWEEPAVMSPEEETECLDVGIDPQDVFVEKECFDTVVMSGEDLAGVSWEAQLNILEFVKQGSNLALDYDKARMDERRRIEVEEEAEEAKMAERAELIFEQFVDEPAKGDGGSSG